MDLTTVAGVVSLMRSAKNHQEWNSNCDKVKKANGGGYPPFWYATCIASGLCDNTLGKGASDLKVEIIS